MTSSKMGRERAGANSVHSLPSLLMATLVLVGCAAPVPPHADEEASVGAGWMSPPMVADSGTVLSSKPTRRATDRSFEADQRRGRQPRAARERQSGVPVRVQLPAVGVNAPVEAVPEEGGALAIPDDIAIAGWDDVTAAAGARAGTTLIAGHRDDSTGGLGEFGPLESAEPGDAVRVTLAGGGTVEYRVERVESYPKADLPPAIVGTLGRHRLALVTCGGPLVAGEDGRLHWAHNVVVWARPLPTY